jgi:SEC-C motif
MSVVGRNDPCPCGSGKKFKKCCLGKQEGAVAFTARDRESGWARLIDFAFRAELDEELDAAEALFWSGWRQAHDDEEARTAMDLVESDAAFNTWFALDFRLASGQTVLDRMLQREAARLPPGEREYLGRMRDTHLRAYQVTDVKAGEGLQLIDLWTGEQIWVRERLATSQLVRWDLLAVRLMRGAEGDLVIDGQPYLYPVRSKDVLLRDVKRAYRDFKRATPFAQPELTDFFKRIGMLFHYCWLEWVALRPLPKLVTAEGDPLIFAKAIFDVQDRETLLAALARHPDLHSEDDGEYVWTEDAPNFRRALGRFIPRDDRLVLETTSQQRVERGRKLLESLAGEAVRFLVTEYEDPARAMERVASSPVRHDEVDEVPAEIQEQLASEYFEQHYRKWPDEPLPALGNRTPREAARLKRVRPKLVALLQEFENMSARNRLDSRPAYDFGWMWAELGLERPGP